MSSTAMSTCRNCHVRLQGQYLSKTIYDQSHSCDNRTFLFSLKFYFDCTKEPEAQKMHAGTIIHVYVLVL